MKFSAANYYEHIFPYITIFLEEIEIYYNLFRKGATRSQLKRYPKIEYGKEKQPGIFRILLETLEPYQANFVKVFGGEEQLKRVKTMKKFIELFKAANKKLARRSRRVAVKDKDLQEPESYKATVALVKKRKEEMAEAKKRVSFLKKRTGSHLSFLQGSDGEYHEEIEGDYDTDEEIFNTGKSEEEVEAAWDKRQAERAKARLDQAKAGYEVSDAVSVVSPEFQAKLVGNNFKKTLPAEALPDKICFAFAYERCDKGDKCEQSHDRMKVEDFLWKQYNRLKFSRFWKDSILQRPPPPAATKYEAKSDGAKMPYNSSTFGQNKMLEFEQGNPPHEVTNILTTAGTADKPLSTAKLGTNRFSPAGAERSAPSA